MVSASLLVSSLVASSWVLFCWYGSFFFWGGTLADLHILSSFYFQAIAATTSLLFWSGTYVDATTTPSSSSSSKRSSSSITNTVSQDKNTFGGSLTQQSLQAGNMDATMEGKHTITLRLYLIRHGETQANLDNVVAGHMDSPLTELGIRQAQAAGRYGELPTTYWRRYSSDLGRASMTAQIILQEISSFSLQSDTTTPTDSKMINTSRYSETKETLSSSLPQVLRMEPRLRERAKGVREGRSKQMSFEQAVTLFHAEQQEAKSQKEMPLYETEDDVWRRVQSWLFDIIQEAQAEYAMECSVTATNADAVSANTAINTHTPQQQSSPPSSSPIDTTLTSTTNSPKPESSLPNNKLYNVFVLSHSGTLRAVIRKLVGSQLPSTIDLTPAGKDGARPGMLYIPNTSITVIDIHVPQQEQDEEHSSVVQRQQQYSFDAKLVELTRAHHLEKVE